MNWYKRANQPGLFDQNPEQDAATPTQTSRPLFDVSSIPARMPHGTNLVQQLEAVTNLQSALALLDQYGVSYNRIQWPGGASDVYVFEDEKGTDQVLETEGNAIFLNDADQWVNDINDISLDRYIPMPDFNKEFWESARPGSVLYHGTPPENIPQIKRRGLQPMNKTRGLSNRFTGPAVFASESEDTAASYGGAVIGIDVAAMKASGYTPTVGMEEPLIEGNQRRAIAWKLGLEDWEPGDQDSTVAEDTVVIYGAIPPRFLRIPK